MKTPGGRDLSLVRLRVRPGTNYVSSARTVLATDDDGVLVPRLDRGLAWLPEITVFGMRVADAVVSLRFFRKADGRSDYEVLGKEGSLFVVRQPSPWSLTASFGERARDILASVTH